jgi:multiple sugar transport system ATP-binding protein
MANVRLEHVTKHYGNTLVLNDLTLDVRDGEFFVLLGPSGCGKSTVLRLIAGLEAPTSGDIYIDHEIVNHLPPRERDVAMVFESPTYALYPHLSAYDNMAFSLRLRHPSPPQSSAPSQESPRERQAERESAIRSRVEQVAGRLGLSALLNRKRSQLSAGHSQSVAFGRAIVREPKVFLMDDPLSQLDASLRAASHAELRDLHRRLNATIIYVTHDQSEAMSLGNRIAVLNEGALEQVGTPQFLYDHPATLFVAGFIGSPPMNLLPVTIQPADNATGLALATPTLTLPLPDQHAERLSSHIDRQVVLGLRPEHIHDARFFPATGPLAALPAHVEVREYLGSEVYLHLNLGGHTLVARMDTRTTARPGDTLPVVLDTNYLHAFHPTTQRTLL